MRQSLAFLGVLAASAPAVETPIVITAPDNSSLFEEPLYLQHESYLPDAPLQRQLTITEAMNTPGILGDPVKAIGYMPGIQTMGGELLIHASKPEESQTSLNHLPIGYLFHMGGLHSVLAPESIEQIDVYLGAFDVTYGDAIGGVIDITPHYPDADRHGYVHVGLLDSSAGLNLGFSEAFGVSLHARRSYFDLLLPRTGTINDDLSYTVFPYYYDTSMLASYRTGHHRFSLEGLWASDRLVIDTQENRVKDPVATGEVDARWGFGSGGLRWRYDLEHYRANTLYSHLYTFERFQVFDGYFLDGYSHTDTFFHASDFDWDAHRLTLGTEISRVRVPLDAYLPAPPEEEQDDYDFTTAPKYPVDEELELWMYSVFAQDVWRLTDWLRVRAGVRGEDSDFGAYQAQVLPRGAVIVDLGTEDTVSAAVGRYSQRAEGYKYLRNLGNPRLTDELSTHYAISWQHRTANLGALSLEPFYKEYDHLALPDRSRRYANSGDGQAWGLDASYRLRTPTWYLLLSYAYQRSFRQITSQDPQEYRFYAEVPHTAQAAASWRLSQSWTLSGLGQYRSGRPYTPIVGTYSGVDDDGSSRLRPIYGQPASRRLPDYYILNLKLARTWSMPGGTSLESSLEIINATLHQNVRSVRYDDQYQRDGYYYDLPFLATIDLTWRF